MNGLTLKEEIVAVLNSAISELNPGHFNGSMASIGVVADEILQRVIEHLDNN